MIPVTKSYLPDREKYFRYIDSIYARHWLTNHGPLVQELTRRLEVYLEIENLLLVANGTLALQIAYRALGLCDGKSRAAAITTPFSFVATTSSLKWEGIEPIFSDIDPYSWCLDPKQVEADLSEDIRALVPVHVFGNSCAVEALELIAATHGLSLIFDGAHAFGVRYRGESLLQHGDATTLSFHATKLFHTIEGGGIIFRRKEHLERARRMINFGMSVTGEIGDLGINAKMSEFQAAMGLCILDDIDEIMEKRAELWCHYHSKLNEIVKFQLTSENCTRNYSYFPVVFESETMLMKVKSSLEERDIHARRYFYPSLDDLLYTTPCVRKENSKSISERILCLPLYPEMSLEDSQKVIDVIYRAVK
ncbi:DegT/DnrJ/EryC1/StrS family aminotransferase [Litchfieldella rifensis]|uniref:DegT/DnrJ/EryC1/StrS family aminotransferase n=1 Tax=Litchfieldella rifensis TaxID=762643 RepID=A0ABV7LT40_9GAMM